MLVYYIQCVVSKIRHTLNKVVRPRKYCCDVIHYLPRNMERQTALEIKAKKTSR